jgi:hypothetical protein
VNLTGVRRALYGKLAGDTTLNNLLATPPADRTKSIYYGFAPDSARYPFVILNRQSGTPSYTLATKPAFETDVWLIKVVDRNTDTDPAEAVSQRLNALLTDASLSIAGGDVVLWLRRESDVDYQEVVEGVTFVHGGSLFRLITEPA